jgi:hypothetical protein
MPRFLSSAPRWARLLSGVLAVVLAAGIAGVAPPGVAAAQDNCPESSPTYTDACGPTFAIPAWGDAGGWTDPSKYSTIQLADFNGDGKDELMARNDQGIEVFWFDTSLGQWRPQVDANGVPQVLSDFRSPLPSETPATDWTKPEYYATIQAADVDGQPGEEVLARAADGMRVYRYAPPAGSNRIDGGSWTRIGTRGPFSDAAGYGDPTLYPTIQVVKLVQNLPPLLVARRHSAGSSSLAFYAWRNGTWLASLTESQTFSDAFSDAACGQPSCYLNIKTGNIAQGDPNGLPLEATALMGRIPQGVTAYDESLAITNFWHLIPGTASNHPTQNSGPFSDVAGGPDCPFTPSTKDCLGASPSYYETLAAANLDGQPGDELFARASDGLRLKRWNGTGFQALATLTDLAGAASSVSASLWGSIRTGDINKDGREEVLALDGKALQAWAYDPTANAWSRLQPSTQLTLTADWLTKPEYYSTIQVGDVDGDGRDEVVARGPFGIRTWFYDRRGTGGWERYLPEGYPDFPGTATAPGQNTGQAAAYDRLSALAESQGLLNGVTPTGSKPAIRDAWAGKNQFTPQSLSGLLTGLLSGLPNSLVGNCSNQTVLEPPTYAACTPPAGSNPFTAADWRDVINQLLREAYLAEQVLDHFGDLEDVRQDVFESEQGTLPAIGDDLELAAAAGNTTDVDMEGYFAGATGIAASIAGLAEAGGPEISAALWVVSELFSMLPSASPTAVSTFPTTYDGLLDKLATARDEMADALDSQRKQVLRDQGLLDLVGQLRSQGTWTLDVDGMKSAARQSFALETYKTLLPTVYDRYVITNCTTPNYLQVCTGPAPGPGVIGNSQNFTTIGLPIVFDETPCAWLPTEWECHFDRNSPPADLMTRIWGPVSSNCTYQPGNENSPLWHFGCSLGVSAAASIGTSPAWAFTTHTDNPVTHGRGAVRATPDLVRASTARGPSASATRAGSRARRSRELLGPLRFTGRVPLASRLRLRRMRVVVDRTLFEHGRREQLARSRSGRRLRPFALRHVRGGLFTAARRGRPRVRLHLRRVGARRGARLDLRLSRVRTRDIRALCTVLPASVSADGRPLELETRLRLRDGKATQRITLRQRWRCVRDRKGEFTGIRPIKLKPPAARPGLAVRLRAPHVLPGGRRAAVRVTVTNRRRARPSRVVSSLWDLRITGRAGGRLRTTGLHELRAGRSRTVRLTVPVPRHARGRACVRVSAKAPGARGAVARSCARVTSTPP